MVFLKLFMCVCVSLFTAGCEKKPGNEAVLPSPAVENEILSNNDSSHNTDIVESVTDEYSDASINNERKSGEDINFESYTELPPKPKVQTERVYVNKEAGYQLTFPENWLGWFYIDDSNPKSIQLFFYGKSKTGTVTFLSYGLEGMPYGLNMFSICAESEVENFDLLDGHKVIGVAKGEKYYFGTGTGATLPILLDPEDCWYNITDEERELAASDWEKVESMNFDDVTQTFKALE